jgi:hypothetical protein
LQLRAILLPIGLLLASVSFVRAEDMLVANEFHVAEGGGIADKTLQQVASPEFQAFAKAACAVYGVDCSSGAGAIRSAAEVGAPIVGRPGSNVYITGTVTNHDGEEWRGIFPRQSDTKYVKRGWPLDALS